MFQQLGQLLLMLVIAILTAEFISFLSRLSGISRLNRKLAAFVRLQVARDAAAISEDLILELNPPRENVWTGQGLIAQLCFNLKRRVTWTLVFYGPMLIATFLVVAVAIATYEVNSWLPYAIRFWMLDLLIGLFYFYSRAIALYLAFVSAIGLAIFQNAVVSDHPVLIWVAPTLLQHAVWIFIFTRVKRNRLLSTDSQPVRSVAIMLVLFALTIPITAGLGVSLATEFGCLQGTALQMSVAWAIGDFVAAVVFCFLSYLHWRRILDLRRFVSWMIRTDNIEMVFAKVASRKLA